MEKYIFKIKKITDKNFGEFYSLLEGDFCYEERKSKEGEMNALKDERFSANFIYENNNLIGYICFWDFEEFVYIEHFAILKRLRGKLYGTNFLRNFISNVGRLIIIEVERPVDELTKKRVSFYKKLGFVVNGYDYVQPSYHKQNDKVLMRIVSFDREISAKEYEKYTEMIKSVVYA